MGVSGQASAAICTLLDGHVGRWATLASAMVALFCIDLAVAWLLSVFRTPHQQLDSASERNVETDDGQPLDLPL